MGNDSMKNILLLARQILSGDISVVEGAKKIAELRDYVINFAPDNIEFEDFEVFLDVEDDTKSLPIDKEIRKQWAAEALKRKDEEIEQLEKKYKNAVFQACNKIIQKLTI